MVSSFSEFHFIVCALLATGFVMWIWKELVDQILLLTRSLQGSVDSHFQILVAVEKGKEMLGVVLNFTHFHLYFYSR